MRENLLSIGAAITGILSLFLGDLLAIAVALIATLLAFFAARRQEKLYTVGIVLGGTVMIFINLQYMGIIKGSAQTEVEAVYSSLRLSNQAYTMLGNDENQEAIIKILNQALQRARKVDKELLDQLIPGFENHFALEYIEGFTQFQEGLTDSDIDKKLKGAILVDLWAVWNQENMKLLEKVRRQKPSLATFFLT